ncbi:Beta-galactosidase 7 [Ancistrocladus abbreviatus]
MSSGIYPVPSFTFRIIEGKTRYGWAKKWKQHYPSSWFLRENGLGIGPIIRVSFQFCCSNSPVHPFAPLKKATIFALGGNQSCFISNWDTKDANAAFNGKAYKIPAWSVCILPDCNDEVYNTAKLNTQTSLMARRAANLVGEEPETLHWQWRSEIFNHLRPKGRENVVGDYTANKLMDQKEVANDTSD